MAAGGSASPAWTVTHSPEARACSNMAAWASIHSGLRPSTGPARSTPTTPASIRRMAASSTGRFQSGSTPPIRQASSATRVPVAASAWAAASPTVASTSSMVRPWSVLSRGQKRSSL